MHCKLTQCDFYNYKWNLYITKLLVSSFYSYYELMRLCITVHGIDAVIIVIVAIIEFTCMWLAFGAFTCRRLAFLAYTWFRFTLVTFACDLFTFRATFTTATRFVFAMRIAFRDRTTRTLGTITLRHYTVYDDNNTITPRYAV